MRIFAYLMVFLFSPMVFSYTSCTDIFHGVYVDHNAAMQACYSAADEDEGMCRGSLDIDGYYTDGYVIRIHNGNGHRSTPYGVRMCSEISPSLYDTFENHIFMAPDWPGGCPQGTTEYPEQGGVCICDKGEFNYETQSCEEPKTCIAPTVYNEDTDLCEKECPIDKPWSDAARDCVAPPEPESCENLTGNPVNFLNGHKLQRESVFQASGDFPLTFSWLYNSFGNHKKSGAGYSVGSKFENGVPVLLGETMLHTEAPIEGSSPKIRLPLDNPDDEYQGNSIKNWRHNHSYFLAHYTLPDGVTERLIAYRPNGSDLRFDSESDTFVARANRNWRITKELDGNQEHIGWTLKVEGRIEKYDVDGRIIRMENEQGQGITYTYSENGVQQETIVDDNGNSITLEYTDDKLTQISRNDGSTHNFEYTDSGLLQSITFSGADSPQRVFRYEDGRFPNALTGVTDEAGNTYSTFTYDEQGRAVRTEHNNGAESVDIEYIDDSTRRLTNALGKQTTYHYSDMNGIKRIASVDGEPSANCAAANRGYTYDDNGFIASEADWEGNTTTYIRDNLGRELSRTEAAGTAEARTITTEWHPEFNEPAKVTTPDSVTIYSYNEEGHLTGKQVSPVQNE